MWHVIQSRVCANSRKGCGTALVVAHGMVLRLVICLALGIDPGLTWSFDLDTAALAELHFYPEGPVLHRLNDTAHLSA